MNKHLRILIGTVEICRQIYDFADGFRQLGHEVDTVTVHKNSFNLELAYDYDWHNYLRTIQANIRHDKIDLKLSSEVNRFLNDYDVYLFQFGGSLLPGNLDFPILRKRGKVVLSFFNGNDIRHWSAAEPTFRKFGLELPKFYRETSLPSNSSLAVFLKDAPYPNRLSEKLQRLRMAEKYANAIFSTPEQSGLAVRPYMHRFFPVNFALYPSHNIPQRDIPMVVHAPSKRQVKGTTDILNVLERLKAEGIAFELKVLENLPNHEVRDLLLRADILIDQPDMPTHGMLALEGMVTGCAVVGGNNEEFVSIPPSRPELHIDSRDLYSPLKRILTDKSLRLKLASEGRPFVEKYHDHRNVAQYLLSCAGYSPNSSYHYYPSFFSTQYQLPSEEKIPDYLKVMTSQIIRQWGLPPNIQPEDLVERGLVASEYLPPTPLIPRWNPDWIKPGI